ncbi:transposase [Bacillus sp. 165]|nr:transposase [Bacillus sp. 165]
MIITNNTRIHKRQLVQDFLAKQKSRLILVCPPLYSPNLNSIERL